MFFQTISSISLIYLCVNYGPVSRFLHACNAVIFSNVVELYYRKMTYNKEYITIPYVYNGKQYLNLIERKGKINNIFKVFDGDGQEITEFFKAIAGPNMNFNNTIVTPNKLSMDSVKIISVENNLNFVTRFFSGDQIIKLNNKQYVDGTDETEMTITETETEDDQTTSTETDYESDSALERSSSPCEESCDAPCEASDDAVNKTVDDAVNKTVDDAVKALDDAVNKTVDDAVKALDDAVNKTVDNSLDNSVSKNNNEINKTTEMEEASTKNNETPDDNNKNYGELKCNNGVCYFENRHYI